MTDMYNDDAEGRSKLSHPTSRFQKGAVVRCVSNDRRCGAEYGEEFKIRNVDHYTRQFGVWGSGRSKWFALKDFEVLVGKSRPTARDDYEQRIAELDRQKAALEKAAAEKAAADAAKAAEKAAGDGYEDAPKLPRPVGTRRNKGPAITPDE